ncbi:TPA: IS3 family transposase [Citrobacter freundii]|nr:IS3 family transposase [Citrobacter freundii]EKV4363071.1 IS3 family transposase [Citrobacter freundii]EKW3670274.1 IS3 family transposase [Citrobacter freundii]ELE2065317.1 IS3 family transposase [Citrobacter freundii]ELK6673951.1 IS3 family transposase [Citrobacter freundii]
MLTEFKRTQRDYPLSFKIAVVEQVEKGEMTYKQAQQRYGIQGRSTYLPLHSGTAYLSLVTDACSRKIEGYHVGENLQTENVVKAFRQALRRRKTTGPLVHHSDRGLQYCSVLYQSVHERNGITCSMTDGYDCYQNALAERINGILKNEFLLSRPADLAQAREMVKESVAIYNHERPHLALKYKTPDDVHQAFYRQKTINLYQD